MLAEVRDRCPDLRAVARARRRLGRRCSTTARSVTDAASSPSARASLQFDDPINIQYTSGTTGFPKGATLSHHNILNNGFFIGEALRYTERDRVCIPVPFYHCFGMVLGNLACTTPRRVHGRPGRRRSTRWRCWRRSRPSAAPSLYGVPTMFIAELDHPRFGEFDLSSLRTGHHGRLAVPGRGDEAGAVADAHARGDHLLRHDRDLAGLDAERTGRSARQARVDRSAASTRTSRSRSSIRPPARSCRAAQPGELCTRGYSVMLGYWNNDEATAQAIDAARWMHTGDLATMDDEGYVNIVGRIKDMIIRGGENIYPREIEEFLYTPSRRQRRAGDRRAERAVRRGGDGLGQAARGRAR